MPVHRPIIENGLYCFRKTYEITQTNEQATEAERQKKHTHNKTPRNHIEKCEPHFVTMHTHNIACDKQRKMGKKCRPSHLMLLFEYVRVFFSF